jgi:hypothetical protein
MTASYFACVHRGGAGDRYSVYPIMLREPLPKIGIPLRAGEPELALDLQVAFAKSYDAGVFDRRIDYRGAPRGKFPAADRSWIKEIAKEKTA